MSVAGVRVVECGTKTVQACMFQLFVARLFAVLTLTTSTMTGDAAGASVDERDALGYTPLMLALRCGNYAEAAVLLFEGQASTTLRDDEYRRTVVEWAELASPSSSMQHRTLRSDPRTRTQTFHTFYCFVFVFCAHVCCATLKVIVLCCTHNGHFYSRPCWRMPAGRPFHFARVFYFFFFI